jgi:hypothetical protein
MPLPSPCISSLLSPYPKFAGFLSDSASEPYLVFLLPGLSIVYAKTKAFWIAQKAEPPSGNPAIMVRK